MLFKCINRILQGIKERNLQRQGKINEKKPLQSLENNFTLIKFTIETI